MRRIFIVLYFIVTVFQLNAQPPCGSNPPAGETCATATPICELNGYCGNTYSYAPNAWGSTGSLTGCGFLGLFSCPGTGLLNTFCGSVENDSYLSFVASSTTISFDVWVTSSVYGDGIQLIVFSTPSCGNNSVTSYYCDQITPGVPEAVSVSGLIVGNTYYIMIDGFAGDLCDYVIGANTGISIPVDVSPLSSTICPGETVNLSATGGNGTYTWNATPQLNTTTGANVIATPPGPGTYTYTVNSATGNPLCPSSTTAIATVIVDNCGCTVNATNSGAVCPGGSVNLFASNVLNATYSWTGPNGFTSTDQNPTGLVMPTTPGTYDYTVTATVFGAPCTSTTTVTVEPLPSVSAGTDVSICVGAQATLSGSGANSYSWNNGISNGTPFSQAAGTATYTVTGTSAAGCTNTDQVDVTVNALPTVNAGTYGPTCLSASSINLVGSPAGGTFSGTGVTGNTFNPSAGTQTITYNYIDANTCSNSATTTITVNPLPFVEAGNNSSFCSSGSAFLGTPAVAGMTYTWSPTAGLDNANIAQPTVNLSTPGIATYTLTVTDVANGGCTSTDNVTVTISASPALTITPNTSVCPGGCATLTVSGADFYSWSPSPDISDVALATQNVCPTATTTYNVTGYAVGNTVVTNGDFSGGATGFTSDYILNSDTQSESTYFVTTNANNTHPNFVGVDHTTGAGNFLVVNGSGTPNSSVWCQTIPVQPNTDYVFSTWVSTLAVGSPASLQFSINGSNLSTPFIAPSATNVWDEFYTTWNSGASTSATICIVNQNTSTGGNDFGIDDIVFSPVCTSTESVTVTVNSNPVVSAGTYPAACIDAADITLVGTPAGGTFSGTGVTGNSFDPTSGTQTITYNYTDGNGCSNSNTATITVNTLPIVSAGTYPAVCASVVSVPLAGTPAGGAFSGTGVSGNAFNPAVGTSTISYVYTDGNGCANNANTIINVNAIPLSDAGSYPAVCQDAPNVNLVGSPAGGVFTGTGVLSGSFDPSVGTQTVTYTYTDGNGCVNTATASMLVNPLPNINGGADLTVCEGEMVTLNGVNGISYSWNNGGIDGQPFTPSLGSLVYTVTGTDANGCVNTDNVMVNTLPMPIASISADVQIGYPILLVNFTNNSSSASTYVWDFGNGQVVSTGNTNDQFMNYSLPGTYIVQLVAGNGFCVVTDTLHIVVVPLPDPIVYIPNVFTPNGDGSNDTFTIDTDFAESIEIQIFNRWGNVVKEINGLNETWNGMVDSNEASDGVYFFKYTVTGINGEVLNGHGNVTLIR